MTDIGRVAYEARFPLPDREKMRMNLWADLPDYVKEIWREVGRACADEARRGAITRCVDYLQARAADERVAAERHKRGARHYKAREAFHVARLYEHDAKRLLHLPGRVGYPKR